MRSSVQPIEHGARDLVRPVELGEVRRAGDDARFVGTAEPLGDTRLARRLPFIKAPTLLIWGEQDRLMPLSYARRFAEKLGGPNETRIIPGAAHLAELDRPDEVARAVLDWLN